MKSMKYALLAVASAAMLSTSPAHSREFGEIYAECGLGGMIGKSNETIAIITNITWDLGTTALQLHRLHCKATLPSSETFLKAKVST